MVQVHMKEEKVIKLSGSRMFPSLWHARKFPPKNSLVLSKCSERYILTRLDNIVPSLGFNSCNNISAGNPSGYYHIRNNITGNYALNYCDMNRTWRCGRTGGWMRVANIDMTDPNQQCPLGLEIWRPPHNTTFNRRLCDRTPRFPSTQHSSCNSTTFPVNGVWYSRVCGRIKAYHFDQVNALSWYAIRGPSQTTIDVPYVDRISLTQGSPRQDIWSFAAGIQEAPSVHAIHQGALVLVQEVSYHHSLVRTTSVIVVLVKWLLELYTFKIHSGMDKDVVHYIAVAALSTALHGSVSSFLRQLLMALNLGCVGITLLHMKQRHLNLLRYMFSEHIFLPVCFICSVVELRTKCCFSITFEC